LPGPGIISIFLEEVRPPPELEDVTITFVAELEDIALLVDSLPVLISLTDLKENGVIADTAFWKPLRATGNGVIKPSVVRHGNSLLGKARSQQSTLASQLGTEQYCALYEWWSLGLLWRDATARQFYCRKFHLDSLQLSHHATSFLSPIVGTCTSSSNRER
jgi:hypothetical protein